MRITKGRRVALSVFGGVAVFWPALLWAHARLTKSEPAAKAESAVAPSMIRLWFSEAPEIALSSITLKDSAGTVHPVGPLMRDGSKLEIMARIDRPLEPGRYTVGWRIASSDGHPITGSFTFAVLAGSPPAADTTRASQPVPPSQTVSEAEPSAEAFPQVASRFATFVALLVLLGTMAFKFGVMDRVDGLGTKAQLEGHARLAHFSIVAASVLIVAAAARLQLQQDLVSDSSHIVHLQRLAAETGWGRALLLQVAAAVIIAVAAWTGRRGSQRAWTVAAIAGVALAFSVGLGGHGGAVENARGTGLLADGLHVLGAAGWLGTLACLIVIGLPTAAAARDGRWEAVASMVNAFSPLALACAGLVLLTGVASAWLRLGALAPLWTSDYGRTLLLKLGLLIGVVGTATYNWLRVKPALGSPESTARLKRSATVELAVGVAVIAVTAVLVALPPPLDMP